MVVVHRLAMAFLQDRRQIEIVAKSKCQLLESLNIQSLPVHVVLTCTQDKKSNLSVRPESIDGQLWPSRGYSSYLIAAYNRRLAKKILLIAANASKTSPYNSNDARGVCYGDWYWVAGTG